MNTLVLHLGSNLGDRQQNLEMAISLLQENLGALQKRSSFYETEAWLGENPAFLPKEVRRQADFLNIALTLKVKSSPLEALEIAQFIEAQMGRIRVLKWGARLIDIDLIFYNDAIINSPRLTLPHLWMANRRFVLIPLAEIIPDWVHPVHEKIIVALLKECTDEGKVVLYIPASKN